MSELEIGTVMADKTVYAGVSPVSGKMLFVLPRDESHLLTYNEAVDYADTLNKVKCFDHDDWRLPTQRELEVIFANKEKGALTGTFNEASEKNRTPFTPPAGRENPGWYRATDWASYTATKNVFLKDGTVDGILKMELTSVRYIREGDFPAPPYAEASPPSATANANHKRLKEISERRKLQNKLS